MAPRIVSADEAREFVRQFEADEPEGMPWGMCPITYGFDHGVGPDDWRITHAGTEDRAVANIDATCDESVVRFIVRAANAHRDLAHTVIAQAEEIARLRAEFARVTTASAESDAMRERVIAAERGRTLLSVRGLSAADAEIMTRIAELEAQKGGAQ